MSLNATRLSAAMQPGIKAAFVAAGATAEGSDAIATALASAIAASVIAEITSNAVVPSLGLISAAPGAPVTGAAVVT